LKNRPSYGSVDAIVPVNVLSKSKARLSPVFRPAERRELSIAMLRDVLAALRSARNVRRVTVVSADKDVREIARRFGAAFLWEGRRRGLNKGVRLAIRNSERKGALAVLVIHADLPLVKPLEIDRFVEQSQGHSVALIPSKDGSGTNALLMNPPDAIRPVFGHRSLKRHLRLAKQRGAASKVLASRGISFDIDKPQDLIQLARKHPRNSTGRFLTEFKPHFRRLPKSSMKVHAFAH
jgi:2-phospho-L-lactate guanylyltransferase